MKGSRVGKSAKIPRRMIGCLVAAMGGALFAFSPSFVPALAYQ